MSLAEAVQGWGTECLCREETYLITDPPAVWIAGVLFPQHIFLS
jgi:hypothetical protein